MSDSIFGEETSTARKAPGHGPSHAEPAYNLASTSGLGASAPADVSNRNTAPDARDKVREGASSAKGVLAGIHGVGEKIRGEFNAGVDKAAGEDSSGGVRTAAEGVNEMQTGQFGSGTRDRELGRSAQANRDLNRE